MKNVFISHASADADTALKICALLESRDVTCWIAPRDIRPGMDYAEAIIGGIEESIATVLILSEKANESIFVKNEIERTFSKGKPIFPVRIREVLPSRGLELFISSSHWVDAWQSPMEARIDQLANSIRSLLGQAPLPIAQPVAKKQAGVRKKMVAGVGGSLLVVVLGAFYLTSAGNRNQQVLPPLQTLGPGYDKNVEASKRAHDLAVEAGKATMKPIGTEKPAPTGKSGASGTMLPLGMIVSEVSIPLTAEYNVVDWRVLDGTGVKWAGGIKANNSGYVRTGTIDAKGYGNISVMATGARGFFNEVSLSYKLMPNSHNSNSEIESLIQKQLNEGSKVKLIRGTCDWEGASTNSAVYEVTVPGKKPVVVFYQFDAGGSAGNTGYDLVVSQSKKYPCDKAASW
jgi:hypothetical protein